MINYLVSILIGVILILSVVIINQTNDQTLLLKTWEGYCNKQNGIGILINPTQYICVKEEALIAFVKVNSIN